MTTNDTKPSSSGSKPASPEASPPVNGYLATQVAEPAAPIESVAADPEDTVALKPRVLPCRGDLERLLGTRDWRKACHFQPHPNGNATYTYRCAECEKAGRICRPLHPSSIRAVVDFVLATEAIRSTDLNEATHETKVALMNSLDAAEDGLKRSVALAPNAPRPNTSEWVDHWRIQRDAEATLRTKLRDFNA
ncbi:hypothetical protein VTJ04DRAFT_3542 [Mycothermus thermophilus]|uniref:uncharacterized protein n=1 Tax=Humicola insolens TaxID=85995 RepID=UPI0037443FCA